MAARTVPTFDPCTLQPLGSGSVPATTASDIQVMLARGRAAQVAFGAASFDKRRAVLRRISNFIVEHQDEICKLSVQDSGKTMMDAHYGELFPVLEKIKFLTEHGEAALARQERPVGTVVHKRAYVEYTPLGVCAIIAPFNWPFHNIMCPVLPVLFAGNAAIIKISEWTSFSTEYYGNILKEALVAEGFSADLVQFVFGWAEEGAALCNSGVDKVFFTGSPENGRRVMAQCSKTLTPCILELGGKDPMIVCDDANLDHAITQAMLGIFTSCGQMCVGTERFYVFSSVYDRFVEEVVRRTKLMSQGPPLEGKHDIGGTTMPRQLDIIESLVNDAVTRGAKVLTGGRRNPTLKGQFWEPTILVDVTHEMRIMKEEHFGPVMVIMKVDSDDMAIRLANDCPYGLGSSVFTRSNARAERYKRELQAGMVVVNDYGISYICQSLPFGGFKISGIGKINGPEGLQGCCNQKAVLEDRFFFSIPLPKLWQYPIEQKDSVALAQAVIKMAYGEGIITKLKAVGSMVPLISKL